MKTKEKIEGKEFDTVRTFREIKENISRDLFGKPAQQIKEYLRANSLKMQNKK